MDYISLCDVIHDRRYSENTGILFINGEQDEHFVPYKDLYYQALKVLYYLQEKGLKQGQELVIQIDDNLRFLEIFWGCMLGGIIPVPLTVGSNDEHRMKLFRVWKTLNEPHLAANSKVLSSLEKFAQKSGLVKDWQEIRNNIILAEEIDKADACGNICKTEPKDIAFIQFSSGSTGDPKGVVLTHENLMANVEAIIRCAAINAKDSLLGWMPLTHDMGMIGLHLVPLLANINQINIPTSLFIRNPMLWFKKASEHKSTILSSPNFGYKYFLSSFKPEIAKDWELSHIRLIFNGAEPISAQLCDKFLSAMSRYGMKRTTMFTVYGMAEASLSVSLPPVGEEFVTVDVSRNTLKVGERVVEVERDNKDCTTFVDVGHAVKYTDIRICKDDGSIADDYVVGHIHIKGKNVTRGYYNNQKETEKVITKDGWLDTGDLGFMRNDRLVIVGRAKDIIFINGQNYYPHDIEMVAQGVEEVELGTVAACGVPNNDTHTEEVCLFIVFKKKLEEFMPLAIRLKDHIRRQMSIEVKEVIPIKKVPKTTSGKIQRYNLSERYRKNEFVMVLEQLKELGTKTQMKDEILEVEERVLQIVNDILGCCEIDINENFFDMGASSILLGQVYERILKQLPGKMLSISDVFDYPTVKRLSERIRALGMECEAVEKNEDRNIDKELEDMIDQMARGNLTVEQLAKSFTTMKGV